MKERNLDENTPTQPRGDIEKNAPIKGKATLSIWEFICFLLATVVFACGVFMTVKNRVDKTPPPNLTIENYKEFISIDTQIGDINATDGLYETYCWVKIKTRAEYAVSDLSITLQLSAENCTFEDVYTLQFDELRGGESFSEKLSMTIDMNAYDGSAAAILNARQTKIEYEVISAQGGISYEK